jgi:hypothetical protein
MRAKRQKNFYLKPCFFFSKHVVSRKIFKRAHQEIFCKKKICRFFFGGPWGPPDLGGPRLDPPCPPASYATGRQKHLRQVQMSEYCSMSSSVAQLVCGLLTGMFSSISCQCDYRDPGFDSQSTHTLSNSTYW